VLAHVLVGEPDCTSPEHALAPRFPAGAHFLGEYFQILLATASEQIGKLFGVNRRDWMRWTFGFSQPAISAEQTQHDPQFSDSNGHHTRASARVPEEA
jgi:hypothetical protein